MISKLGLDPLVSLAARDAAPPPGADTAKAFEALMVRQLLDELPLGLEGTQAEQFASLMYDALAHQLVEAGGLGLADSLQRPPLPPGGGGGEGHYRAPDPSPGITSAFGVRTDPIDGTRRKHDGVDLDAPAGAPIRALRSGVVRFAGEAGGYGNLVIVDHGGGLESRYAHCARLDVAVGERVGAGQALATVGATGRATGPHLHLEVRQDDVPVDPSPYLDAAPKSIAGRIRGGDQRGVPPRTQGLP